MGGSANDARLVLAAFSRALSNNLSAAECYCAGTLVWRTLHPDHNPTYAARCAVAIMLRERLGTIGPRDGYSLPSGLGY